jgi:hypothetical protein
MRRVLLISSMILGAFVLYALSFGPVLLLCHAKASTGWKGLPLAVQIVYQPLAYAPQPLVNVFEQYVQLWMDMER